MELRDLQYFAVIADVGNLGRAAKQLSRSAPALTKCVHRLEDAFGGSLFERTRRGMRLTAAGEILRQRVGTLQRIFDDTTREIEDLTRGSRGHIKLGVAPTVAQYLMPSACRLFLAKFGDVTFDMAIGIYPVLREALKAGRIDLAISMMPS